MGANSPGRMRSEGPGRSRWGRSRRNSFTCMRSVTSSQPATSVTSLRSLVRSFARDGALEMYHAVTAHDPELVHVDAAILTDEIPQYPSTSPPEWLESGGRRPGWRDSAVAGASLPVPSASRAHSTQKRAAEAAPEASQGNRTAAVGALSVSPVDHPLQGGVDRLHLSQAAIVQARKDAAARSPCTRSASSASRSSAIHRRSASASRNSFRSAARLRRSAFTSSPRVRASMSWSEEQGPRQLGLSACARADGVSSRRAGLVPGNWSWRFPLLRGGGGGGGGGGRLLRVGAATSQPRDLASLRAGRQRLPLLRRAVYAAPAIS